MKTNVIYNKSCLSMPEIDDSSIDTVITSPPYWGLRDYGVADQIGLEPTLKEYIDKMFMVTAECKRVLKPTGVMWWNHGDCYGGSGHGTSSKAKVEDSKESYLLPFGRNVTSKSTPKCLAGQNYRLILRMIDEQGWILRNTIIWSKPNGMPSSVKDRLSNKYEPVFMLVKNKKYWFDLDAIREKYTKPLDRWGGHKTKPTDKSKGEQFAVQERVGRERRPDPSGKNPGDVWTIPTQPYPEAHFATFPEKLIIKPILSSCPKWICKKCGKARVRITRKGELIEKRNPEKGTQVKFDREEKFDHNYGLRNGYQKFQTETIGWTDCGCNVGWRAGIILDPFAGSGTTLAMAHKYNRQYIGYEIAKSYLPLIRKKLKAEKTLWDVKSE